MTSGMDMPKRNRGSGLPFLMNAVFIQSVQIGYRYPMIATVGLIVSSSGDFDVHVVGLGQKRKDKTKEKKGSYRCTKC